MVSTKVDPALSLVATRVSPMPDRVMMTHYIIDGELSGTGVRDAVEGGYVDLAEVGLSDALAADIADWVERYEDLHFRGFPSDELAMLDEEGVALTARVQAEAPGKRFAYYSHGQMKRLP